ncbi:MAG: restriction endonuclease subunit S [Candidatus Onthomorpha sp.]
MATNLPPTPCNLTSYQPGDILMANIRPYLKKVWMADTTGGCSADVLVFRTKENVSSEYLYSVLLQDSFFDYVMLAPKGSKMPRGDKDHIMRFPICDLPNDDTIKVGDLICKIEAKLANNRKQNAILEKMAKQIYDYWFVQFDFPDENGRPYKSSGGKMVWNETLKREIPEGWEVCNLYRIAKFTNGLACQKYRPKEGESSLPVIKIKEMHEGISPETERVSSSIPESVKIYDGDILFSWSASLEVMLWAYGEGGLNQHIFKVTPKDGFPKSYVFFQLLHYIVVFRAMAEARKTTMGHITTDHIMQSRICIPTESYLYENFENEMEPFFEKFITNSKEIIQLQSLRSYLLPLLMTGQAKLKNKDDN